MATRTLARMVKKMEQATAGARAAAEWSAKHEERRRLIRRIMACPEAYRLAIDAGEWMMKNAPRDANPLDYPVMVEKIREGARVLEAHEAKMAAAATQC